MTNQLTTIEQQNVAFYDDTVIAVRASDDAVVTELCVTLTVTPMSPQPHVTTGAAMKRR